MSSTTKEPVEHLDDAAGVSIQETTGKLTGRPLFRVAGTEMPWMRSAAEALRVHSVLRKAIETGYFNAADNKAAPRSKATPKEL